MEKKVIKATVEALIPLFTEGLQSGRQLLTYQSHL